MVLTFNYGFSYKNIDFGWNKKKLYRLPQIIGKRYFTLNEVKKTADNRYIIYDTLKSVKQLQEMTVKIPKIEISIVKGDDVPF